MSQDDDLRDYDQFRDAAEQVLADHRANLHDEILAKIPNSGHWHPNGFAIWQVREIPGLGTLRLHIWPAANRTTRSWGPRIHRHGWHLASAILAGTYTDVLFRDYREPPSSGECRPMVAYRFESLPGGVREVIPDDEVVFIQETERRAATPPAFHHMPIGLFHETTIPEGAFVATLIVEGRHGVQESLGLEDQHFPRRRHERVPIDSRDTERLLGELRSRL